MYPAARDFGPLASNFFAGILMAGEDARGTASNYFVDGASAESQLRLMSRPCRMEGHPAREYLEAADQANGVNQAGAQ